MPEKDQQYARCFEIQKTCDTYHEFFLKVSIEGIDDAYVYTEQQFRDIHKLYVTYFIHLEKQSK